MPMDEDVKQFIGQEMRSVRQALETLVESIGELKGDVRSLYEGKSTVERDIAVVCEKQRALEIRTDHIETHVSDLVKDLDTYKKEQGRSNNFQKTAIGAVAAIVSGMKLLGL